MNPLEVRQHEISRAATPGVTPRALEGLPWIMFVAGVAVITTIGIITLSTASLDVILRDYSSDDSFYYYEIARILASA